MAELREKLRKYVSEHRLFAPGDRVAIAVSGGADSVALLRLLLELRKELGISVSVAHFHHNIRGAEADADQQFVADLASEYDLGFHCASGDAPRLSHEQKISLETAARELRHEWFASLVTQSIVDKVATGHTLDDQAETVLMRIVRGTGSRGLSAISPYHSEKRLVRPLLAISRSELVKYLRSLKQPWREDATNQDPRHTRNRVRHNLLPLLERDFNPAIRETLSELAEIARGEAEYWKAEAERLLSGLLKEGKPSRSGRSSGASDGRVWSVELRPLNALPLAIRRHVLKSMAENAGADLDFKHLQALTDLAEKSARRRKLHLPGGLSASCSFRELQIEAAQPSATQEYELILPVPGEVEIPSLCSRIRARLLRPSEADVSGYNPALLLERARLTPDLKVRNWRAGDRFFPAHTQSPRKVKELLQASRLGRELSDVERRSWPVVESGGQIVWMRGFPVPADYVCRGAEAVLIEEIATDPGAE
ncbi:MAG TPA: tRNA lysidine(34) synthetase TilS [Candidatus Angelobacter sp.]|nr:tRNA lysidine(34) synthetase TilS [Candidatus Angelobacter sp.]